ncbi:hypothetical protein D9M72_308670 [compost metagenome]
MLRLGLQLVSASGRYAAGAVVGLGAIDVDIEADTRHPSSWARLPGSPRPKDQQPFLGAAVNPDATLHVWDNGEHTINNHAIERGLRLFGLVFPAPWIALTSRRP